MTVQYVGLSNEPSDNLTTAPIMFEATLDDQTSDTLSNGGLPYQFYDSAGSEIAAVASGQKDQRTSRVLAGPTNNTADYFGAASTPGPVITTPYASRHGLLLTHNDERNYNRLHQITDANAQNAGLPLTEGSGATPISGYAVGDNARLFYREHIGHALLKYALAKEIYPTAWVTFWNWPRTNRHDDTDPFQINTTESYPLSASDYVCPAIYQKAFDDNNKAWIIASLNNGITYRKHEDDPMMVYINPRSKNVGGGVAKYLTPDQFDWIIDQCALRRYEYIVNWSQTLPWNGSWFIDYINCTQAGDGSWSGTPADHNILTASPLVDCTIVVTGNTAVITNNTGNWAAPFNVAGDSTTPGWNWLIGRYVTVEWPGGGANDNTRYLCTAATANTMTFDVSLFNPSNDGPVANVGLTAPANTQPPDSGPLNTPYNASTGASWTSDELLNYWADQLKARIDYWNNFTMAKLNLTYEADYTPPSGRNYNTAKASPQQHTPNGNAVIQQEFVAAANTEVEIFNSSDDASLSACSYIMVTSTNAGELCWCGDNGGSADEVGGITIGPGSPFIARVNAGTVQVRIGHSTYADYFTGGTLANLTRMKYRASSGESVGTVEFFGLE